MRIKFIILTALIIIFTTFANAQSSLIGEWKIVSITDAKVGNVPLDKVRNTITFEKNSFNGLFCNNFGGKYSVAKNKLNFANVITTVKACPGMNAEMLIKSVFRQMMRFSLNNNVLTLTEQKKQITLQLEKVKKEKPSLIGSWQLHSLKLNGKYFEPTNENEISLNIEKGKIGGNGGCNSYGGNVAMKGNTVKFSNIISTKMFCEGSIENEYFAALEKVVNFELKNDQLILTDKTKRTVLIFDQVTK